jgi:hypothetical protein
MDESPTLRLAGGWRDAVRELGPSPLRWWITPALADEALAAEARPGDRVLVRGDARDLEHGATDLELLRWLVHAGIEVRRHPRLNLRAYVAVHPGEGDAPRRARAWIGSAEATPRGRGERHGGTFEAMAGPFDLAPADLRTLDALWEGAETLEPERLADELRVLRRAAEMAAMATAAGGRWTVRIEIDAGTGRWTAPHVRRSGEGEGPYDEDDAIAFLDARDPLRRQVVAFSRALRTSLRRDGLALALPGELGANAYLVAAERADELRAMLDLADDRLSERVGERLRARRTELAGAFAARVEVALARQAERIPAERGVAPDWSATRSEAMRAFDAFVDGRPVSVRYALAVPLDSNDPLYRAAAATFQPTLLPPADGTAGDRVEEALRRSGLRDDG